MKISPNAARNEVSAIDDDVVQVRVAAPPEKGKANRELLAFLSKLLGVKKSSLAITRGHTGRHKVISITGLGHDAVRQCLTAGLAASGVSSKQSRGRRPRPE